MMNGSIQTRFTLNGKRALIAGGTGGLGSSIAKAFLQSGTSSFVTVRSLG